MVIHVCRRTPIDRIWRLGCPDPERMARAENPIDEDELSAEEKIALKNHVGLEQRAYPLLKMLEEAAKKEVDVHWGF